MSQRATTRTLAVLALCLSGGALWLLWQSPSKDREPDTAAERKSPKPTRLDPAQPDRPLVIRAESNGPPLRIAMDEFCLRAPDGTETIVKLDPPATASTLRKRLAVYSAGGEAMPVAYPEDEERDEVNRRIVTRQLRVQFPEEADAGRVASVNDLEITGRPDYAPGWIIMSAADPFAALAAVNGVRASAQVSSADVLLAKRRFKKAMPNDPMIASQWHLKNATLNPGITHANVESVWRYGLTGGVRGAGIRIGIVDDGLQTAHPDLAANVDTVNDRDWNGNDSDPNPVLSSDEHGTACAGVAGARGNNALGVSGVAPEATLVGMRLISSSVSDSQEAEAMNWQNAIIQVKSNSWGPFDSGNLLEAPEPLTTAAFQNAVTNGRGGKGTIFIWAGGNGRAFSDNSNYDGYANLIQTIAVGASDSNGDQSSYSESGANLVVVAPSSGVTGITTTDRTGNNGYASGDYYSSFGGTSSATPVVAGVVAMMLEKNPNLGWRDVQEILFRSANVIRPNDSDWVTNGAGFKFNHKFGGGLVNADAAVTMASTWMNLPAQANLTSSFTGNSAIPESSSTGVEFPFFFSTTTHRVEHVTVKLTASHTSRGNLAVTLTSPSGMVSRLAEVHSDANDNYPAWTFSSVRHWGESAAGTWRVKVADLSGTGNTTGGSVSNVVVTLFGSSNVPVNPPPQVQITSPANGQEFSSGSTVNVQVNASDVAIDGGPGSVVGVELLVDNVPIAIDETPPYQFTFSPSDGSHSLVARATDSFGAVGTSSMVMIAVENQPPLVSAAALSVITQAFADEAISVTSVTATDPEGSPVTYSYQWQSSTDDLTYTPAIGRTAAALPPSEANAGKLWRCAVTASDGSTNSAPFVTTPINLLRRPLLIAKAGSSYQFSGGLVLKGQQEIINRRAVINEFSQGNVNFLNYEWVEILTLQSGGLAGWTIQNKALGNISFNSHSLWQNLPAGTLVVIYNGGLPDTNLPPNDFDASDGRIVVAHNNLTYFSTNPWPVLGTNGDTISLINSAATTHKVSFGSDTTGAPALAGVGNLQSARFAGGSDAGANLAENWTIGTAGSATPGAANSTANQTFINKIRTNTLSEIPLFRIGAGSSVPAGLTLNTTTGELSGTISANATRGDHTIIIERYNALGEIVSQTFTLRVFAANYSQWIGDFTVTSNSPPVDNDGDGLPNLVEYLLDLEPDQIEETAPVAFATEPDTISLTYRQSKLPADATLTAEWSDGLENLSAWQSTGIVVTQLEEDESSKLMRASLEILPGQPKRFLRLKAVQVP